MLSAQDPAADLGALVVSVQDPAEAHNCWVWCHLQWSAAVACRLVTVAQSTQQPAPPPIAAGGRRTFSELPALACSAAWSPSAGEVQTLAAVEAGLDLGAYDWAVAADPVRSPRSVPNRDAACRAAPHVPWGVPVAASGAGLDLCLAAVPSLCPGPHCRSPDSSATWPRPWIQPWAAVWPVAWEMSGRGYPGGCSWETAAPSAGVLGLRSVRHATLPAPLSRQLTGLPHGSWSTATSSHRHAPRVSLLLLLLGWLAILLVVAIVLGRRSPLLRRRSCLLVHVAVASLVAVVPASALVLIPVVPLLILAMLVVAIVVVLLLLAVLSVVARLLPRLLRGALIVLRLLLLLSRLLLVLVVVLPLPLLLVGHWRSCTLSDGWEIASTRLHKSGSGNALDAPALFQVYSQQS